MRRVATRTLIIGAATAALTALTTPLAVADPGAAPGSSPQGPSLSGSSLPPQLDDAASTAHRAAQDAYRSLPPEVRDNPGVRSQADALGLRNPAPGQGSQPGAQPSGNAPAGGTKGASPDCSNCVAITYDDGPGPHTQRLLDILAHNNVHASFMVTGHNASSYPAQLKEMAAAGHTIGNHTENHPQLTGLDYGKIDGELDRTNAAIASATGAPARWMRPPYGATNDTVARAAADDGMAQALWSVDTEDWKHRDSTAVCQAAVTGAAPGAIILMHDIHPTTVDAAQCVIDGLRSKGLEPVSLDTLIPQAQPGKAYYQR